MNSGGNFEKKNLGKNPKSFCGFLRISKYMQEGILAANPVKISKKNIHQISGGVPSIVLEKNPWRNSLIPPEESLQNRTFEASFF